MIARVTTDYDPIAELYKRSKQTPWRTEVECFTLLETIGAVDGLSALDIACGEGFYTRLLRHRGAARMTGVDLSEGMVALARKQEAEAPLGIEYRVGDGAALDLPEIYDLVVAAYLLNYATTRAVLGAMCRSVARALKPGGRFVTVNSNPGLDFSTAPSYRQYGFETSVVGAWIEGAPVTWKFFLEDGTFEIENYGLSTAIHDDALREAGFRAVRWHAPRVSPEGRLIHGDAFWRTFLTAPPITILECVKA
jgi:ubiquinone/menaquinone biosynthesis C-methylase UbiE